MSSSLVLDIPAEYGYVLLAAASSFFVNAYHVFLTGTKRRAAGVKYPISYVDDEVAQKDPKAFAFNCAQRAHANFTENHTSFLGPLLIAGLRFPVASSALGAFWVLGRCLYARGYANSGPDGRRLGSFMHYLADTPLKFMAIYTAVNLALGK